MEASGYIPVPNCRSFQSTTPCEFSRVLPSMSSTSDGSNAAA